MAPRNEICLKSENLSEDFFISIVENKLKITRDQFKLIMPFISSNPIKNGSVSFVVYPTEIKIEHNDGRKESVHAVVKSLTGMSEFNKEIGVFAREKMMYEDVVSSFQKIWEEVGVELDFGTRILKTETYPYEILVLDDLGKSGYVLPDRKVGVDLNVSKLLLSKLAKFHAASAVRFLKDGIINKHFDRKSLKIAEPEKGTHNPMFDFNMNMLRAFHNVVQSWGPEYRVYADKIQKWTHESLNTGYMVVAEPMNCGLQVLNHGSLNSCKFQTKYDEENNPIDVLLTDFNASFWGSPACDLLSFLMTSVQNNVKVEYFDDLIEHYHLELAEGLKKLSYQKQIPSLKELHADILDKGAYGPYILLIFNMSRSNTDITFDQLYKGGDEVDKLFKIVFENEIFVKACRKWMPFLNSREFLECLI